MERRNLNRKPKAAAIVLAAGLGKRMRSRRAKVLHRVAGAPMVERVVRACIEARLAPVVVVVGRHKERVEATVRRAFPGARLEFAWQREQKGTGHAVATGLGALRGFRGRVVITSGDTPLQRPATLARLAASRATVAFVTVRFSDPTGYGRVVRDGARRPSRIVEEKDATPRERRIREVNAGLYGVDAAWIRRVITRLRANNAQGEFYLTDIVALASADGLSRETILARDPVEVAGVNTREDLVALDEIARQRAAQTAPYCGRLLNHSAVSRSPSRNGMRTA